MAQRAGRITCPRCGANNFDTVTSCWKCGAPVGAASLSASMQTPLSAAATIPSPYVQERSPASVVYTPQASNGDSGVARRAAVALGLTIPFVGLPVGWIFMMIEDRNKQAIGRWCATWSMIGLVLHLFVTWFMIQQSVPFMMTMLKLVGPAVEGASRRSAGGSEGVPGGGGLP